MPVLNLTPSAFDQLEKTLNFPNVSLDYGPFLDHLANGHEVGAPSVLQLSSTLIRVSQVFREFDSVFSWSDINFELRLSGAGISPVSSLNALTNAINNGLATGALNNVAIFASSVPVLNLHMDATGYVLSSGGQSVTLGGALPLTFAKLFDMADLFVKVTNIESLTKVQRNALFNDLDAYSVDTFTVKDGARIVFSAHMDATSASLTVNGLSLNLTGTFPSTLGGDLETLWQAWQQSQRFGSIDFAALGLSVTEMTLTDAAGKVIGRMNSPADGTPLDWSMGGRPMDAVAVGDNSFDTLVDLTPGSKTIMAGLGGNDFMDGRDDNDRMFGGSGNDTMLGGRGNDRLDGGAGRDKMDGGLGSDVFVFQRGDGFDSISGFKPGTDVIEILSANALSDLTFTSVNGGVWVKFQTIHVFVEDVTIPQLRDIDNFNF